MASAVGRVGIGVALAGAGALACAAFVPLGGQYGAGTPETALRYGGWVWVVSAVAIAGSALWVLNDHGSAWPLPMAVCLLSSLSIVSSGADPTVMEGFGGPLHVAAAGVAIAFLGSVMIAVDARAATRRRNADQRAGACPSCRRPAAAGVKVCTHCGVAVGRYESDR